jgi:hypothetical protein
MASYQRVYRDYTEWNRPKGDTRSQLDGIDDPEHGQNLESLFDAAVRHRFGVFISRGRLASDAASSMPHHSFRKRGAEKL